MKEKIHLFLLCKLQKITDVRLLWESSISHCQYANFKGGITPLLAGYHGNILVGKKLLYVTMVTCMQGCNTCLRKIDFYPPPS